MNSPYDMVTARMQTANGTMEVYMRPFQFDSEPVDLNTMKNAFGLVIRPTRLSSSCPNCGCLVDVEVTTDLLYKCGECYREPKKPVFTPFVSDPIASIKSIIFTPPALIDDSADNLSNLLEYLSPKDE